MQSNIMMMSQMNTNYSNKIIEFQKYFMNLSEDEPELNQTKQNPLFQNSIRENMTKWLKFLCEKLNFTNQTLFRSVIIFDKYISALKGQELELTQEKLNLIAIACLSLGTKMEEINCNYVSFFSEKVLNMPNCPIFSVKDLTKMEIQVMKKLKYKTLYSTALDFNEIYVGILKTFFDGNIQNNENLLQAVKVFSENLMKENITTDAYLTMTQSNFAYMCFNQAFFQLGLSNLLIVKQIALTLFNLLSQNGNNNSYYYNHNMKNTQNIFQNYNLIPCSPLSSLI